MRNNRDGFDMDVNVKVEFLKRFKGVFERLEFEINTGAESQATLAVLHGCFDLEWQGGRGLPNPLKPYYEIGRCFRDAFDKPEGILVQEHVERTLIPLARSLFDLVSVLDEAGCRQLTQILRKITYPKKLTKTHAPTREQQQRERLEAVNDLRHIFESQDTYATSTREAILKKRETLKQIASKCPRANPVNVLNFLKQEAVYWRMQSLASNRAERCGASNGFPVNPERLCSVS